MMCFKIFISAFIIIFVVNVEIVQTEFNLKAINTYQTPKSTFLGLSNNGINASRLVPLPQNKYTFSHKKKEKHLKQLNTQRPNNLKKIVPGSKINTAHNTNRVLKTNFDKYKKNPLKNKATKRQTQIEDDGVENDYEKDFVPSQLLSQTRHHSNKKHFPLDIEEPQLREVIKDTKVHIEYTEEGYEDIGYDHAGEERNEETNEGYQSKTTNPAKSKNYGQLQVDIEKEFENYEKVNHDDEDDEKHDETSNKSKRFTNDIPTIQINNYLATIKKEPAEILTTEKYPYYKMKNDKAFSKHSALRYAENIKNRPKKIEGDLSFYKHTGAFKCDEIVLNINPLPNKTHGNNTSIVPGPRLKNLGGKILCLKSKYFGNNPLDNPLFSETSVEEPQPFFQTNRKKRSLSSNTQIMKKNDLEEPLPESSPLRLRKRRRKYPVPLFRGNSYFPTPVPPILTFSSTVFPRYKTISEVYYKDEIQPNEQLNVFADVMNNIKKTQNDLVGADTEFVEDRNVSFNTANKKNNVKIKVPLRRIKIRQSTVNNLPEISTTTTTTTTEKLQTRRRNNFKNHKPDSQVFEEYVNTIKDVKDNVQKPLNVKNNYILDQSKLEDVIGLSPPTIERSTIVPSHVQSQKVILNTFPVTGMKPPISYRPIYSGVINPKQQNRIRRKNYFHIVHKRSAEKRVYSEIRRNKPQQPDVLDDDYTPNRNRNFHYDTKTKQVVYTNPEPETKEEQIEENSYEDTTDKIPFFEPSTTTTTTTTEAGPSFLDYIQQVKTHKRYQYITEPTEKPKESTTQQHTTVPVSSDTPDFLKFVSKLKQNEGYVIITEKSKTKTTTQPSKIDNEDSQELQIFDITEYLPKQESYVPSVTIDYSKYKTIQRKPIDNSKIVLEEDNDTSAVRDDFTEQSTLSKVTTTEAEPTTRKQRLRTRRPLSKTRYTEATTTSTTVIPSRSTKRRFRSTTQPTTEIFQETYNQTQRPVRRRLTTRSLKPSQAVPLNHKEVYTPINDTRKHKRLRLSSYTNKDEETSTLDQSNVDEPENKSLDSYETRSDKENQQNLEEVSLKNIKIIKDPSKRSYYYVPVK